MGTLEYKLPNGVTNSTSNKSGGKSTTKPASTSGTKTSSTANGSGSSQVANLGFNEVGYDPNKCKTCGKKK